MDINPKDYKLLFRISDYKASCLVSEFLLSGSLKACSPLVVNYKGSWAFYVKNSKVDRVSRIGLRMFKNKSYFEKYINNFNEYISKANTEILAKYKTFPESISFSELEYLLKYLSKFWYFYGFTENVYTDFAYRYASEKNNKLVLENIEKMNIIKTEGRKIWDSYVSENGLVKQLIIHFSNKYLNINDGAKYLISRDLKKVILNKTFDSNIIEARKNSYIMLNKFGRSVFVEGNNSEKISKLFFEQDQDQIENFTGNLKGVVASQGKVVGKAFIVPMFNKEDAVEASKKINTGDILIAQSTNPDLVMIMKKAGAIVTDQGGLLSHAAIISRELNIPCIVGTKMATKVFKNGDLLEVDAFSGEVKLVSK